LGAQYTAARSAVAEWQARSCPPEAPLRRNRGMRPIDTVDEHAGNVSKRG
jgi:hypothetical protein